MSNSSGALSASVKRAADDIEMSPDQNSVPSVSVVIPAYQARATIRRAVDSILAQTVRVSQVLVVDDGSSDGIGPELASYDPRVVLIRKPNGGAASARNRGIDAATGDLVAFLDADDYWERDKLECQLNVFRDHPELGLVAAQYFEEPPGGGRFKVLSQSTTFDRVLSVRGAQAFRAAMEVWTGTVLVRRALLGDNRFVSGLEPAEDRDLWMRLVSSTPIYIISKPLATAVLEAGSLSRSSVSRDCSNMLRVVKRQRRELGYFSTRMWASHTYFRWGACETRPTKALGKLAKSLLLWPLPFERHFVNQRWARAKAVAINLQRLVQRSRRAEDRS